MTTKAFREVSDEGREFIEAEEGKILFAYDDSVYPTRPAKIGDRIGGTLTIGVGHTGPDVAVGMTATEAQIDKWLDDDLDIAERAVANLVKVSLNDNQHATLVSFAFNVGVGGFEGSSVLRAVNRGDFAAVPGLLALWNKTTIDGKKVESKGLTKRRADEAALWSTPEHMTITTTYKDVTADTVAEPQATQTAVRRGNSIIDIIGGLFGKKAIDPLTGKSEPRVTPIDKPFKSKINWSLIVTVAANILVFFGLDIPEEQRTQIVVAISAVGGIITWIISTFFRKQ